MSSDLHKSENSSGARSLDKCQNTGVGGWTGQDVYWTPLVQGRLRANLHTLSHKTQNAFKAE